MLSYIGYAFVAKLLESLKHLHWYHGVGDRRSLTNQWDVWSATGNWFAFLFAVRWWWKVSLDLGMVHQIERPNKTHMVVYPANFHSYQSDSQLQRRKSYPCEHTSAQGIIVKYRLKSMLIVRGISWRTRWDEECETQGCDCRTLVRSSDVRHNLLIPFPLSLAVLFISLSFPFSSLLVCTVLPSSVSHS